MAVVFEVACTCGHILVARFEQSVPSPGNCPSCGRELIPEQVAMTIREEP